MTASRHHESLLPTISRPCMSGVSFASAARLLLYGSAVDVRRRGDESAVDERIVLAIVDERYLPRLADCVQPYRGCAARLWLGCKPSTICIEFGF
jgi:hypothetical protein